MYISNFPYYNRRVLPLFNGASDCIPKGRHVHLKKPRTFFFVFYRNLVFWKSKKKKTFVKALKCGVSLKTKIIFNVRQYLLSPAHYKPPVSGSLRGQLTTFSRARSWILPRTAEAFVIDGRNADDIFFYLLFPIIVRDTVRMYRSTN